METEIHRKASEFVNSAFELSDKEPETFQKRLLADTADRYPCGNCVFFRKDKKACTVGLDSISAMEDKNCNEYKSASKNTSRGLFPEL
jgi:hypothetical protein